MLSKRFTLSTFALSALAAVQSAGAQERAPGQIIPSNGQPQVSDQQISATQNREGIGAQPQTGSQPAPAIQVPGVGTPTTVGPIVDGQGTLSGQPTTTTQNGITTLQNQQGNYEARRAPMDGTHAGMSVQQVVVHKLMKGNQAEIELAQMAQQEANSDKVKQFAQMMIKDHQQALQQLQQQNGNGQPGSSTNANGDQNRQEGTSGTNAGTVNPNGVNQPETSSQEQDAVNQNRVGQANATNQTNTLQASGANSSMQQDRVPQQFVQLIDKTCDNSLQQAKEMLQQHRNEDFDMAYMGHQIVMHSIMLAELKALESDGPKQLQPVVQNAKRTTEGHLKEAKQIAEQLTSNHPDQKDGKNQNQGQDSGSNREN